jgi:DNA-binding MarR family transcriptional regulator
MPLSQAQILTEELGRLIAQTRRKAWTGASKKLESTGETMLGWQVILNLVRSGKCSQTELAHAISQHPAGVSRVVDDLEKRGRVTRCRDPKDRRRVQVAVSPAGRQWFATATPLVMQAVDQALGPLSKAERRVLRDLLRRVVADDEDTWRARS